LINRGLFLFYPMRNLPYILLPLALFITVAPLKAQLIDLDTIYLNGSATIKKIKQTGRNITVLEKEQIEKIPGNSLDEILRYFPGIDVTLRGPAGAQADFSIRGSTFQQVLVLIDGIRMNEPLTGHFNSYIPVLKHEIQRIEIIKGAAASIYGPDAVGGVIQIITRKEFPSETQKQLGGEFKWGEYGLLQQQLYGSWESKKTILSLGGERLHTNGQPLRGTKGFVENSLYSIQLAKKLKKNWRLQFRAAIDKRHFNAQNFYTSFLSDTANEKVNSTWQQMALYKLTPQNEVHLLIGARQLQDIYTFRPGVSPNQNETKSLNVDFRHIKKYNNAKTKWTLGTQSFRKNIQSNDRGNHSHQHVGLYSTLQHQPLSNFYVTEGIRADWDQSYGWVLVPQLNISYIRNKFSWRASIGRGIRDADFTERYNNYNKTIVTSGRIGNPALEAEKSTTIESGFDFFPTNTIQLHVTAFERIQKNMIDWVNTPFSKMPRQVNLVSTGLYALASNIANVNTQGIEFDFQGSHSLSPTQSINWSFGATTLRYKATDSLSSLYLNASANFIATAAAQLQLKKGFVAISALYKRRPGNSSNNFIVPLSKTLTLFNLKAERAIWKNKVNGFIQLENLFNVSYSDFLGAQLPKRWLVTGIRFNFQHTNKIAP